MANVTEGANQIEISSVDSERYYTSLIRLLDKIELDNSDQMLNDDLANVYQLLALLSSSYSFNKSET